MPPTPAVAPPPASATACGLDSGGTGLGPDSGAVGPRDRAPASGTPPVIAPARVRRAVALVLALCLLGVAHHLRPTPYEDRLVRPAPWQSQPGAGTWTLRARGADVAAYDTRTGALRWRYARVGHRPLAVLTTRVEVIALWEDGLLADTDGRSVRWHRALPDWAEWLPAQGGTGVLRLLGHGILAVVTPQRVTAYRIADGDLRWVLPAGQSCAFRPEGAVRRGTALLIARPCAQGAWTGQLVALDDLGRIVPGRTPLGNDLPHRSARHGPNART
ncbi:hypothetical protein [Streptomyces sp. NPDC052107]|uniref:hypothetical protein n=1 Tax=Streptomyces sp. NPDC052107 TaxID=3155632 RepID=UPI00344226FF